MSDSYKKLVFQPLAGINSEDAEDSLEQGQVAQSNNMVYYGGETRNRPGLVPLGIAGMGEAAQFGYSRYIGTVPPPFTDPQPVTLLFGASTGKIYYISGAGTASEITGGGTTFGAQQYHNMSLVNGVFLIANNAGGLLRWDPNSLILSYSTITSVKPRYVTGHFTRAVAAYNLNGGTLAGPRYVAWSKPGDESVWNSPGGVDGSGSAVLADIPDDITGLFNLHNVVVVGRRYGFHLGAPTGNALQPFDWKSWSYYSQGLFWPGTAAVWDNTLYYVSENDVCTFDLGQVQSIGYNIRSQLMAELIAGARYNGYITRKWLGAKCRPFYNLWQIGGNVHYQFDLTDHTWSRHTYALNGAYGFQRVTGTALDSCPCYVGTANPPVLNHWSEAAACEVASSITGPVHVLETEGEEGNVQRVLLKVRDTGAATAVTITITGKQAGQNVTVTDTQQPGLTADGKWTSMWFNTRLSANEIQVKLDVPASQKFSCNKWMIEYAPGPRFRT